MEELIWVFGKSVEVKSKDYFYSFIFGGFIMSNLHTSWQQGYFVDQHKYRKWSDDEKRRANEREKLLVRPSPTGNAICQCNTPEDAKWIADRLNFAAKLEQMTYDFATGKTDGSEIIKMVQNAIDS